jgi:Ca2+/H+ antiporter
MSAQVSTATSGRRFPLPAPERLLLILLVFIPLAALADWLHWGAVQRFAFAALAIIPLAGLMGSATETLAHVSARE